MKNRILVLGDVCLDKHVYGKVTRRSPEDKSVDVLKVDRIVTKDGMAQNVFNNLSTIGARVTSLRDVKVPKIQKIRIHDSGKQILRVDIDEYEKDFAFEETIIQIEAIKDSISTIVISDYGKGFFNEKFLQYSLNTMEALTIVDPYPTTPLSWYRDCDIIMPNYNEAKALTGKTKLEDIAKEISRKVNPRWIIIKHSENGMYLFGPPTRGFDKYKHFPVPKLIKNPDPCGAGDTAIAVLAYLCDLGYDIYQCVKGANMAAGMVVQKSGVASLTESEFKKVLRYSSHNVQKQKRKRSSP